ncbi:MAG TPA: LamG domain-containing protein [Verrucomicrobiales bacterium]|nr:LamG domain-containing protein [Verrucomicrobiales bacterium]
MKNIFAHIDHTIIIMKKKLLGAALIVAFSTTSFLQAQTIIPVWENLITKTDPSIPILKANPLGSFKDDAADGSSTSDSYGGFKRYDADRLLLGVRDNGINETEEGHDAELAALYPDRSLIWINPDDGSYLGIALEVGHAPVALDQDFLDAGGSDSDYYFNFGVSEDGVIYVGYKNKVLRYAPDGIGGFDSATIAYTHLNDSSDRWHQWRWENFRISGTGSDTVILAGPKTWRPAQGYYRLITDNGTDFVSSIFGVMIPNGYGNAAGGGSTIIQSRDPEFPDDQWVYVSTYPGSDRGDGTTFYRFIGFPPFSDTYFKDGDFTAHKSADAPQTAYRTEFISDVDAHPDLDYVVTYSTPSWNSRTIGRDVRSPGFLAVHDMDGEVVSVYQLNVTEDDEVINDDEGNPDAALFHAFMGSVSLNLLPAGGGGEPTVELLWYSGIYGFGRYTIENTLFDEFGRGYFHFDNGFTSATGTMTPATGLVDNEAAGPLPEITTEGSSGAEGDWAIITNETTRNNYFDENGSLQLENTDFTLESWVKFDAFDSGRRIIFGYGIPGGYSMSVSSGGGQNTLFTTTYGIADLPSTAVVPSDNAWHHVAVVHVNGQEMQYYIDGQLSDTVSYSGGVSAAGDPTLYIGHEINGLNGWVGGIDRIRITGAALSPDQFDLGTGGDEPGDPAQITFAVNDQGQFVVSWEGNGHLQNAAEVTGPWGDLAGSASPHTLPVEGLGQFFRVAE